MTKLRIKPQKQTKDSSDDSSNQTSSLGFKYVLEYLIAIISLLTTGFFIGSFYKEMKDNVVIMELNLEHEKEIRELENNIQEQRLLNGRRSEDEINKIIQILNENLKHDEKK